EGLIPVGGLGRSNGWVVFPASPHAQAVAEYSLVTGTERGAWETRPIRPAGSPVVRLFSEDESFMSRQNADPGVNGRFPLARRSDQFLAGLAHVPRVTFVSHVQPDPDSIGSMLGLAHL